MKDRTVFVILVVLALIAGGIYLVRGRASQQPSGAASGAAVTAPATSAAAPKPVAEGPTVQAGRNGVQVPLQDGKTIDMSSGRAVVRDDERSRAAIEKAKKEMAEAAASVTFTPVPQPPPKQPVPAPKP